MVNPAVPLDMANRSLVSRGMVIPQNSDILNRRTRQALKKGSYERKECLAVLKLTKPGDVVMELGGGIGYISTLIATQTQAKMVHSFEGNPGLVPYIRDMHRWNGATNVQVENAVLGDENSSTLFYARRNFLSSSLDPMDGSGVVAKHTIPVLDKNETMARVAPNVLVCDIEGGEVELMRGLDMSGLRAAVIELHPQLIGNDGVRQVVDAMHSAGLVYFPRWSEAKVVCFRRDW